jgi:hypothetical protein
MKACYPNVMVKVADGRTNESTDVFVNGIKAGRNEHVSIAAKEPLRRDIYRDGHFKLILGRYVHVKEAFVTSLLPIWAASGCAHWHRYPISNGPFMNLARMGSLHRSLPIQW